MFEALRNLTNDLAFGPHERRVRKYLEQATADSVLQDLNGVLSPKSKKIRHLRQTFEAHCIERPDGSQYWTEGAFTLYLESIHPNINQRSVTLLWRCFCFYAYCPFPRDVTDARIDFAAFERAIALLVARSTDLFGMQDDGSYYWRHDEAFYHKVDLYRIIRSIGSSPNEGAAHVAFGRDLTSSLDDIVDTVALTMPYYIKLAPSPDQLTAAARSLLENNSTLQGDFVVTGEDLSTLLSLTRSLRLHKATWGPSLHFGTLDQSECSGEELVDALVEQIQTDSESVLISDEVIRALDARLDLRSRFYLLWSVLFQPTDADFVFGGIA